jgi:hypothetical protein
MFSYYINNMRSRQMRISSKERIVEESDSSSSFVVNFNNCSDMQLVKKIVIKQVSIPNVGYNINESNNTFTFNILTLPTIITLTQGQYDITQLIAAITADAAALAVGLAITVNATTGKLEFTSTTAIEYLTKTQGNLMADNLGIKTGSGGDVLSYDADGFPDLRGDQELYIGSSTLGDGNNLCDPRLQIASIAAIVPVTVPYNFTEHYTTEHESIDDIHYPSAGGGLDWVMIVKMYY